MGDTLGLPVGEDIVGRAVGGTEGHAVGLIVGFIDGVDVVGAVVGA